MQSARFIPNNTLQDTQDLPSCYHLRCSKGHSGPFRPINIRGGHWLQCRYIGLEEVSEQGHCDQRFAIEIEELTMQVNPDVYSRITDFIMTKG